MHTAIAHIHPIDDGITKWFAALNDSPAHESDIIVHQRACQHVPGPWQPKSVSTPSAALAAHPRIALFTRFPNLFTPVIQPSRRHRVEAKNAGLQGNRSDTQRS
jgi:hypothetical protein